MNNTAERIKRVLQAIHNVERTSTKPDGLLRARAVEHVFQTCEALEPFEVNILLNALHVSRTEINTQWPLTCETQVQ